jgi:tRNA(Ile)-lysidine synthase
MKSLPPPEWGKECRAGLPNDGRYLVGVSGGRDSVVLLHWLLSLGYRRLVVCHFDHQLRGRAGKADARFVERLACNHGLAFAGGSADVARLAKQRKQSIETTGREERLAFFQQVGKRRRCPTIFFAHQADDQVETFLLRLFRGAGGRGLGAMRPQSRFQSLTVVRPFLGVWRTEIDQYVRQHRLLFREDATNTDLALRRNRIRKVIIPFLEKQLGRKLKETIWRTATILAEEDDFLETVWPHGLTKETSLSVSALRELAPALQRRVLRDWLVKRKVPEIGFSVIESVRQLLTLESPAKLNLAGNRHVRRRAGKIFLEGRALSRPSGRHRGRPSNSAVT